VGLLVQQHRHPQQAAAGVAVGIHVRQQYNSARLGKPSAERRNILCVRIFNVGRISSHSFLIACKNTIFLWIPISFFVPFLKKVVFLQKLSIPAVAEIDRNTAI
jgi:hypothetical protein